MIVRELLAKLGFKVDDEKLKTWSAQTEKAKRHMADAAKTAKAMAKAVVGITAAAAAGAGAVIKLVQSTADMGDQAAKDAKKLSLTAEAVQELGYAAKLSGANFGTVKVGLQALTRGLNDAATKGTGPAAEAFEQLGISLDDPALKSKNLEQILPMLADKFRALENGTDKTALAMKLFSRSGAELIPMLNEGSAGLATMRKEARELGLVISNEDAAASEQFNDDLERLKSTVAGLKNSIGAELMPTLNRYTNKAREWILANRELIAQRIGEWIDRLASAGRELVPVLRGVVAIVQESIPVVRFMFDHWKELLAIWGGIKTASILSSVVEALGAIKIAAGATGASGAFAALGTSAGAALGPIGLLAGAFVALLPIAIKMGDAIGDVAANLTATGRAAAEATREAGGQTTKRGGAAPVQPELAAQFRTLETRRKNAEESLTLAKAGHGAGYEKAYWEGELGRLDQKRAALSRKNQALFEKKEKERKAFEADVEGEFWGPEMPTRAPKVRRSGGKGRKKKDDTFDREGYEEAVARLKSIGVEPDLDALRKQYTKKEKKKDDPTADEIIERDFGEGGKLTGGPGTGGIKRAQTSPLGTTINRIDASFRSEDKVTINATQRSGESAGDFAKRVVELIQDHEDSRNRAAADHFRTSIQGVLG